MKKGWIAWLVAFLLLVGAVQLVGCKETQAPPADGSTETGTDTSTGDNSDSDVPDITEILVENLSEMKIVFPQEATPEISNAAKNLQTAIQTSYQKKIESTTDFLREGSNVYRELPYEILLGDTAREESGKVLTDLLLGDWGWALSGKKIVIKGGDEESLVTAINTFAYDILLMKKGGDKILYNVAWNTVSRYNYPARQMQWNGVDAQSFTIVYPATGTNFEKQLAERLADRLSLMAGTDAWKVLPDSEATEGEYILSIGNTSHSGKEKTISLSGDTARKLALAENEFLSRITSASENGTVSLTLSEPVTGDETDNFNVMTYNVFGFNVKAPRTERLCRLVLRYLPDVILFQETADDWMQVLNGAFSEYYGVALGLPRHGGQPITGRGADTYLPIFYAKDRYELIESGTRWLTDTPEEVSLLPGAEYYRTFTWAKLRDLQTGEEFVVVNNHLDTANKLIRQQEIQMVLTYLAKKYTNDPILLGGDMNDSVNTPSLNLVKDCGFVSAATGYAGIDWIFCTADCVEAIGWTLCNDKIDGESPSDHSAVMSVFIVRKPETPISRDWGALEIIDGIQIKTDDEIGFGQLVPLY